MINKSVLLHKKYRAIENTLNHRVLICGRVILYCCALKEKGKERERERERERARERESKRESERERNGERERWKNSERDGQRE